MKRFSLSMLIALIAVLVIVGGAFAAQLTFRSLMTPNDIIPLPMNVDSSARGTAVFRLSSDESAMAYRLNVSNIDQVTMAHIHQYVGDGRNGPILVWLYPGTTSTGPGAPTGSVRGTLAEGTFGSEHVRGGFTWEQVIEMMRNGEAYVNVHTSAAPAGEINGHIH